MNNASANYGSGSPHVDFDLNHNKNMFNTIQRGKQEISGDRDVYKTTEEYRNQQAINAIARPRLSQEVDALINDDSGLIEMTGDDTEANIFDRDSDGDGER